MLCTGNLACHNHGFTSAVLGLRAGRVQPIAAVQQPSGRRWGWPVGWASAAGRAVGTAVVEHTAAGTVEAVGTVGAEHIAERTAGLLAVRIGPSACAIMVQC